MKDSELIDFYRGDSAIQISLEGTEFPIPAKWEVRPEEWDLPWMTEWCDQPFASDITQQSPSVDLPADFVDGKVVRLQSVCRGPGGLKFRLQPARYRDAICTNFRMDELLRIPSQGRRLGPPNPPQDLPPLLPQSLRQSLHGSFQSAGELNQSPLANHIGIVGMIQTADGYLLVQSRSNKVSNRKNSASASVSGAMSMADFTSEMISQSEIKEALVHTLHRECMEELGLEIQNPKFLGMIREFQRGGKPEVYFFADTQSTLKDAVRLHSKAVDRSESWRIMGVEPQSEIDFVSRLKSKISNDSPLANFTLRTGIILCRGAAH